MPTRRADAPLREHLSRALSWSEAHLDLETAVRGLPARLRGKRPKGGPHSPWELLEHIRLAQRDLLDFSREADYREGEFPASYWPPAPAPPSPAAWKRSLEAAIADRKALETLVRTTPDLLADVPTREGKSILRSVLLVLDHTAYHVGQIALVRKLLGA